MEKQPKATDSLKLLQNTQNKESLKSDCIKNEVICELYRGNKNNFLVSLSQWRKSEMNGDK